MWINNWPWFWETEGLESIITNLCCCFSMHSDKDVTQLGSHIRFLLSHYVCKCTLNTSPGACIILSPAAKSFNISISQTATISSVIISSVNCPQAFWLLVPQGKFLGMIRKDARKKTYKERGLYPDSYIIFSKKNHWLNCNSAKEQPDSWNYSDFLLRNCISDSCWKNVSKMRETLLDFGI